VPDETTDIRRRTARRATVSLGAQAGPSAAEGGAGAGGLPRLLTDYMVREHLTLQAMAERSGLSLATVAALRSGTRGARPHPVTLRKLAAAMGVGVTTLARAIDGEAADRARERHLLDQFRSLDDDAKVKVERLLGRLTDRD
jgi:transcriptional regulator with XRE-family HTH domain